MVCPISVRPGAINAISLTAGERPRFLPEPYHASARAAAVARDDCRFCLPGAGAQCARRALPAGCAQLAGGAGKTDGFTQDREVDLALIHRLSLASPCAELSIAGGD